MANCLIETMEEEVGGLDDGAAGAATAMKFVLNVS